LPAVIIRAPLLYGQRVKGNLRRLLSLIDRGLPLPLASVHNSRSLLYAGNLADAICLCLEHPGAVGQTFLLSDGEDLSTPELIGRLARARGRRARLLRMPPAALFCCARLLGRSEEAERLLGSLRIDGSLIRSRLGWTPPFTVDAGLLETARGFLPS
jgi:nucleoside-diphosphate-sugar epimerase